MYDLVSLGPDACQWDSSASCLYWHTKRRAMAGAALTDEELRFVGFAEECPDRGGWQDASRHLEILYADHDRDELSAEDAETLHALMAIDNPAELPPAYALEFLSG
jgi:hypothetical protein